MGLLRVAESVDLCAITEFAICSSTERSGARVYGVAASRLPFGMAFLGFGTLGISAFLSDTADRTEDGTGDISRAGGNVSQLPIG